MSGKVQCLFNFKWGEDNENQIMIGHNYTEGKNIKTLKNSIYFINEMINNLKLKPINFKNIYDVSNKTSEKIYKKNILDYKIPVNIIDYEYFHMSDYNSSLLQKYSLNFSFNNVDREALKSFDNTSGFIIFKIDLNNKIINLATLKGQNDVTINERELLKDFNTSDFFFETPMSYFSKFGESKVEKEEIIKEFNNAINNFDKDYKVEIINDREQFEKQIFEFKKDSYKFLPKIVEDLELYHERRMELGYTNTLEI